MEEILQIYRALLNVNRDTWAQFHQHIYVQLLRP